MEGTVVELLPNLCQSSQLLVVTELGACNETWRHLSCLWQPKEEIYSLSTIFSWTSPSGCQHLFWQTGWNKIPSLPYLCRGQTLWSSLLCLFLSTSHWNKWSGSGTQQLPWSLLTFRAFLTDSSTGWMFVDNSLNPTGPVEGHVSFHTGGS